MAQQGRQSRVALALMLVFSMLVVATISTVTGLDELARRRLTPRDISAYVGQHVVWGACNKQLRLPDLVDSVVGLETYNCAKVRVPANYLGTEPTPDFEIRLMRRHKVGAPDNLPLIVVNPGGPGGSGIEQVQWSQFPDALTDKYDFVGFDPRGVGASTLEGGKNISCSKLLTFRKNFGGGFVHNDGEYQNWLTRNNDYYRDCAAKNPFWFTLSTENVVRDLDLIRQATQGDRPLNYIGSSYGAFIGALYATRYSKHVSKLVLDSPAEMTNDEVKSAKHWYTTQEKTLNGFLHQYAKYSGITDDEAYKRLLQSKKWAEQGKTIGFLGTETIRKEVDGTWITKGNAALISDGIIALNYEDKFRAQMDFDYALDQLYLEKDNTFFEGLAAWYYQINFENKGKPAIHEGEIERSNAWEVMYIVDTMDYTPIDGGLTDTQSKKAKKKLKKIAPKWWAINSPSNHYHYKGNDHGLSWASMAFSDPNVPDPATAYPKVTNKVGSHILVVGSLNDPVTPYPGAEALAKQLAAGLISVDANVHGIAGDYSNRCVNENLLTFFDSAPATVKSTSCPAAK